MAQHYKLLQFKPSDFEDRNGNYWCTARFESVGEPVTWVMKPETVQKINEGGMYYGEIRDYTSSKGKVMPRFYKETEPEGGQQEAPLSPSGGTTKKEWIPRDDDAIRAQWAIGQAVQLYRTWNKERPELEEIESAATKLFAMVERVKAPVQVRANLITAETSVEEIQARAELARDTQRLINTTQDELVEVGSEPINLDDIPF